MLQLLDGLIFRANRSIAVYGLAAVIHHQHKLNGCSDLLGWEHFKRQLGDVLQARMAERMHALEPAPQFSLHPPHPPPCPPHPPPPTSTQPPAHHPAPRPPFTQEYGFLMCMLMVLPYLAVVGGATGILAECPCCAAAGPDRPLHSLNIDFCFGLPHLAGSGTASVQLRPPNTQLYVHGPHVGELLLQVSSGAVAADAERACSDFNAATALARTSEKASLVICCPHFCAPASRMFPGAARTTDAHCCLPPLCTTSHAHHQCTQLTPASPAV